MSTKMEALKYKLDVNIICLIKKQKYFLNIYLI